VWKRLPGRDLNPEWTNLGAGEKGGMFPRGEHSQKENMWQQGYAPRSEVKKTVCDRARMFLRNQGDRQTLPIDARAEKVGRNKALNRISLVKKARGGVGKNFVAPGTEGRLKFSDGINVTDAPYSLL